MLQSKQSITLNNSLYARVANKTLPKEDCRGHIQGTTSCRPPAQLCQLSAHVSICDHANKHMLSLATRVVVWQIPDKTYSNCLLKTHYPAMTYGQKGTLHMLFTEVTQQADKS